MSKRTYYASIYFAEKDPGDTRCTLLVRIFEKHTTPSGNTVTTIKTDCFSYANSDDMVKEITDHGWKELPPESEHDQLWVPNGFKAKTVRRVYA